MDISRKNPCKASTASAAELATNGPLPAFVADSASNVTAKRCGPSPAGPNRTADQSSSGSGAVRALAGFGLPRLSLRLGNAGRVSLGYGGQFSTFGLRLGDAGDFSLLNGLLTL